MADAANHIFLSWVQPGVATNIPDQATERLSADQPAVISLPVRLEINQSAVEKNARLYGPGDVTGLDPQQVIRLEPRNRTTDFEPNYFPAIEFDRPDFPWLFTPAKADAQGRLRPWLCLVVVRKQEGVEIRAASDKALPVLDIKSPARPADELPNLAESHFWAHAQVTGSAISDLGTTLDKQPSRTVSRLLCPRRLDPATDYIGCLVPAFEVGRKAGLAEPTEEDKLKPAWLSGSEAPEEITLPVYYSWEFRTSAGGDFEELVRRLQPRELPAEVGKRPMDISDPGFAIDPPISPTAPGALLGLEGALRVVGSQPDPWPDEVRARFQSALAKILNKPWELATTEVPDPDPVLGPPIYGCWQAAIHRVGNRPTPPPPPIWLDELNLDPRNRAVAAMGTQVIQQQQEALMASAWEQLGDIEKINQRLRQAQLSRAVNEKYHTKTFSRFSDDAFVKVVAPARSRVVVEDARPNQPPTTMLLAQKLAGSFMTQAAISAPLRKVARPRGAINRQYTRAGVIGLRAIAIGPSGITPAQQTGAPVTVDQISDALLATVHSTRNFIFVTQPPPPRWERMRVGQMEMMNRFRLNHLSPGSMVAGTGGPPPSPEFVAAVTQHHSYLSGLFMKLLMFPVFRLIITPQEIKAAVMTSLTPGRTVSQAVLAGAAINSPRPPTGDELDPIMDAPTFPQPMYEGLRDLSGDYLFPGLEHVPPNTVQLLQTNAKFIESFMVGLNAEMSRELLWRNYPTDQRGTYFQHFWDTAAAGAKAKLDITPIHEWRDRSLGSTATTGGGDQLVLLIRGELLRRYPGTIIYAVKAVEREIAVDPATDPTGLEHRTVREPSTEDKDQSYPVFRGSLDPDVTFVGFDLTAKEVVDGAGWFFVLQQQPTEPRFGLDDDPFGVGESGEIPVLKTWNDLNWAHLAPSAEALKKLSHVSVAAVQLFPTEQTTGSWGRNAAHMAFITKQLPVRVAIHATELLPEKAG